MQRHYFCLAFCLSAFLLLNACQQLLTQEPQSQPSAIEAVPTTLLAGASPDSLINLSGLIDFSLVSHTGQGPTGRLIRWGNRESSGRWRSFTYDAAGRLIGVFQEEYGTRTTELARYQGNYLAESIKKYSNESTYEDRIYQVKHYRYDRQGRLSQTLIYQGNMDKPNVYRLYTWLLHEYDGQGRLHKVRRQSINPETFYDVFYWQYGDCVRQEKYFIAGLGKVDQLQERTEISFGPRADPLSQLPLYDEYTTQPSQHYAISSVTYQIQDGVETPFLNCRFTSDFEYDEQRRLSRMRYSAGNLWEYFTYAPAH